MHLNGSFIKRHKGFVVMMLLLLAAAGFLICRMKGPYRSYHLDFIKIGHGPAEEMIQVGVALRDITPDMTGTTPSWMLTTTMPTNPNPGSSVFSRP